MKKITESELRDMTSRLREKIVLAEGGATNPAAQAGAAPTAQGVGQVVGQVAGAPVAAANWVGDKVGQAFDWAKQGVSNFASGVQQGYNQMTGSTQAAQPPAQATGKPQATAQPAKVAYDKGYPEATVKELQTKLNAAGEKLTVDGKMGPATRAAQARHPEITTQPAAAQAVAADMNKAEKGPAVAAPAATPTTTAATPAAPAQAPAAAPAGGNGTTITVNGKQVDPNSPEGKAATAQATQAGNMATQMGNMATQMGAAAGQLRSGSGAPVTSGSGQPVTTATESVGFDELQRLVSLVHYR